MLVEAGKGRPYCTRHRRDHPPAGGIGGRVPPHLWGGAPARSQGEVAPTFWRRLRAATLPAGAGWAALLRSAAGSPGSGIPCRRPSAAVRARYCGCQRFRDGSVTVTFMLGVLGVQLVPAANWTAVIRQTCPSTKSTFPNRRGGVLQNRRTARNRSSNPKRPAGDRRPPCCCA